MKVPVTKSPRARGEFRRNVVQLRAQLRLVAVLQLLAAQALEVVLHEEVQLPRELRLVEGEAAGDGLALVGERGRRLYVGDESDGLFDVRLALVFGGRLEDAAQLLVAEILLHDDAVQRVNVEDFGHGQ